jgi:hypothetical protein
MANEFIGNDATSSAADKDNSKEATGLRSEPDYESSMIEGHVNRENTKGRISSLYRTLAHKSARPALIYSTVLSIITSSTGRIISSGKKCLLILLGLATIKFDLPAREALLSPAGVEQTPPHPLF